MNFKRKMGLLSIIFAVCMVFGLFPATVSASDSDDNPVDIINHILNGENKGEITERLQNIDKSDLDFLFDKLEDLINANDSIVPAVTKEKLLSYGINSTTTEAFLQDVFGSDGVISNQASWDAFVDAFENNRVFDEGSDKGLLTYYTDLNEAFTDNFPQAKDALKLYDLIDLSDAALAIISLESFDPFNPSTEDKEAINDAIDSISTDLKDKLKLYGIDWVAYHQAIQTALSEGIITESDKLKIKSILGFTVIINPVDVTIDDGKAEVSLPDFPTTSDGKTEAVTVPITISSQVSALLGLPAGSTVEIALPSLQLESGQTAPTITLAPIPAGITTGSRPAEEILTVEITVSGLAQGQTVTLSLPIPSGLSNPGAFHWNGSRWEYREATVKGNVIEFDTDLSPVLIGEAVDAPTNLTAASTTSSSVTLQWNSAFSGATYEVYQGDTKVGETSDTQYMVSGLSSSTAYTLKVRALDADDFESAFATLQVTTSSSGGGGGSGGGSSNTFTVSDSDVTKQLTAGNEEITVTVPSGTTKVIIKTSTYNKISQADKDLVIKIDKITFRIPAGTFAVSGSSDITLSVSELSADNADKVVAKMESNYQVVGKVFELTSSQTPQEDIEVTIFYNGATVKNEDNLDAYWYNEATNAWVAMKGEANEDDNSITFTTTHFSKYGVFELTAGTAAGSFADISGHWAKDDIEFMVSKGVINGISATQFAPNAAVTRAQFAAMLVRALDLEPETGSSLTFKDVKSSDWFYGEVAAAFKAGIIEGIDANTFAPNANISREQMAAMMARAMEYAGKGATMTDEQAQQQLTVFKDASQIAAWAKVDVAKALQAGIIKGRTDDTFVAKAPATRAESAVMIKRMYVQIH